MDETIEDLTGAIKNGIERGQSLESIRASLINAGYNHEKIEEAIQSNPEFAEKETPKEISSLGEKPKIFNGIERQPQSIKSKGLSTKTIVYILIFLLILAIIGGVFLWIFKDKIL